MPKRISKTTKLAILAATAAGSLGMAPAASAVPVTVSPPMSMYEASPSHFRFETPSVREKAIGGSIQVFASYDAVFDPAVDPLVGTATFTPELPHYASVPVIVDDRVANRDKQHIWTFFYIASPGIELNVPTHQITVNDDDYTKQGFLSSLITFKGRTLKSSYTFMEPRAEGTIYVKNGKKTIGKKKIRNRTDSSRTVRFSIRLGSKNYSRIRSKRKVTLEFRGKSATRDLGVRSVYKLRR